MQKNRKIYVFVAILSFIILSGFFVSCFKIPHLDAWQNLIKTSYRPHYNIIFYGTIGPLPINIFSMIVVSLTAFILALLNKFLASKQPEQHEKESFSTFLIISLMAFLPLWLGLQTYSQFRVWQANYGRYANQTEMEKFSGARIGQSLQMAKFCHHALPNLDRTAELATDLDLSRDPGMIMHRSLAFYLYPVDIRNVRMQKPDTWIAYEKDNAKNFVPNGFTIIAELDEKNIIAIKDN